MPNNLYAHIERRPQEKSIETCVKTPLPSVQNHGAFQGIKWDRREANDSGYSLGNVNVHFWREIANILPLQNFV
jgi:hypothetical protein